MTVKEFLNKMSVTSSTETIELLEHMKTVQVLDYTSIRTGDCHGFENYRVNIFAILQDKLLIYIVK